MRWSAIILFVPLFLATPVSAQTQAPALMCASAEKAMSGNAALAEAVAQAFPVRQTAPATAETCIHPYELLDYETASVLLTTHGEPGQDCHACTATLSAYFLKHEGSGRRLVAAHVDALETGSYGSPGAATGLRFGGDDAFTLEQIAGNQGYFQTYLLFYVFRAGHMVELKDANVITAITNEGGEENPRKRNNVKGKVTIDNQRGAVHVDYRGTLHGKPFTGSVDWIRTGNSLRVRAGARTQKILEAALG